MRVKRSARWRKVAARMIVRFANKMRGAEETRIISQWSPKRTALWVAAFLALAGVFWLEYLLISASVLRGIRALLIPVVWGITFVCYWFWYVFWFLARVEPGWAAKSGNGSDET